MGATVLDQLRVRTRPVALAEEERLPVLGALAGLFPGGGLRRGTTVSVGGSGGSTSLALALLAGPSQAGSWTAVVGCPDLGLVAAAELGVDLERLALVPWPGAGGQWPTVVSALLDAVDVVAVRPPGRAKAGDVRRLTAKARERGAVLLPVGPASWPDAADVRLAVTGSRWDGLGPGHGRLAACQVDLTVSGRGSAARERRVTLWLPDHHGEVSAQTGTEHRFMPTLGEKSA